MKTMLEKSLEQRSEKGNLRHLKLTKNLIDFASNDYLGLSRSAQMALLSAKETVECTKPLNGMCSTGSRLLTGNSPYAQNLEERLAKFHGFEAGLLFNCGYMANAGLISSIAGNDDLIFFDTHVHASMLDGFRLSKARSLAFRHQDLNHLEQRLKKLDCKGNRWICVESIYSTDGSQALLKEMVQLAVLYDAYLIVDEAHAVGVCGPQGRGLVAEYGLQPQIFAQITTFGKALGSYGAIIFGSSELKQYLINFSRNFIYTTALPFQILASIKSSYELFPQWDRERQSLKKLIELFYSTGLTTSKTPIQCVKIPGNEAVKRAAHKLEVAGYDVRPLVSPTVRQGHEILRICLHAFNTEEQVHDLISLIQLVL